MVRESKNGLWWESAGGVVTLGVTKDILVSGKPKSVEALPAGTTLKAGGPLLLVTAGRKEVEFDSPVSGKIIEVRAGLMKDAGAIAADPDHEWILKISVGGAVDDDDEDDDDDVIIDDEDDDEPAPKAKSAKKK